ncbi:MAG: hypothetical protein CMJ81_06505 [Planctomycetaceae bacterium]|nr:hypothetical protein [Planctomycetaceae bacterium]MBP63094.1 hypothetical protein [Planctomycetaceae bacterium]
MMAFEKIVWRLAKSQERVPCREHHTGNEKGGSSPYSNGLGWGKALLSLRRSKRIGSEHPGILPVGRNLPETGCHTRPTTSELLTAGFPAHFRKFPERPPGPRGSLRQR